MAKTFTERFTDLGGKLDKVNSQIMDLLQKKTEIMDDIQTLVQGADSPVSDTPRTAKKQNGKLGDRILTYLSNNPGPQNTATIANKIHTTVTRVGVASWHLINKGLIRKSGDNMYEATTPVAMAAKTTPDKTE